MTILDERDVAHKGNNTANFRIEDIANSASFRELYQNAPNVVAASASSLPATSLILRA